MSGLFRIKRGTVGGRKDSFHLEKQKKRQKKQDAFLINNITLSFTHLTALVRWDDLYKPLFELLMSLQWTRRANHLILRNQIPYYL